MTLFQAIFLGFVQGATEFIPVSSSGHIVLLPWILGWESPGLPFTVVVHVGTMVGVVLFFWEDWQLMLTGSLAWLSAPRRSKLMADPHRHMLVLIVMGFIPAGVAGLLLRGFFERIFKIPLIAALMLMLTAALLFISERLGRLDRETDEMTWVDSLLIGLSQALAIIPGISRSGATIAAGRLLHLKREDAARFSFLLSTPLIIGVGMVQIWNLLEIRINMAEASVLAGGFLAAMISAYFVIKWLLNFLKTRSTVIFAVYCAIASAGSLVLILLRGA